MDELNINEAQDAISSIIPLMTKAMDTSISRLAVLIDSDNVPYDSISKTLNELEKYGEITLKRAYGDFTIQNSKQGWKKFCTENAINMIQTPQYRKGKNTTDITLTIQAMLMLASNLYDGFCIVSSDSDFTPLAMVLREYNKKVYIAGNSQTPEALRKACNKFIPLEDSKDNRSTERVNPSLPIDFSGHLYKIFEKSEDGWLPASTLGKKIKDEGLDYQTIHPAIRYKSFNDFIEKNPNIFEYNMRENGRDPSNNKNMYVRLKA